MPVHFIIKIHNLYTYKCKYMYSFMYQIVYRIYNVYISLCYICVCVCVCVYGKANLSPNKPPPKPLKDACINKISLKKSLQICHLHENIPLS